ncbi:methylated-DNA--[protein]-cysteine S-methyltransferase [Paraliomyxa miuraensis]|uniref:methylated-DNA--[protein]-cysteine S-methyltransferase n=1 Tax=Paraliomyxa miuraensis TaxID=376150 RepID=UPI002B1CC253|nr:methylated-DNA--[protein]-cysteine S-methyltransferase [Paraliomyxa miuraensis]
MERWRIAWVRDERLPLVVVTDADDALVYVGFSLETRARFDDLRAHAARQGAALEDDPRPQSEATRQLAEYLQAQRRAFELPLRPLGTEFQRRAWAALCEIPYGQIRSYGQQAASLGQPGAARAVGHANGQNPISVVVPCHRVVGSTGKLTGFGGGIEAKRWLLELERRGVVPQWSPRPGPRNPAKNEVGADQLGLSLGHELG